MESEIELEQIKPDDASGSMLEEPDISHDRSLEDAYPEVVRSPMAIEWGGGRIELVDASSSLREVLDVAYDLAYEDWIILRRPFWGDVDDEYAQAYFYAFHPGELFNFSHQHPRAFDQSVPAIYALDLHEESSSVLNDPSNVPLDQQVYLRQPSQTRVVVLNDATNPTMVAMVGEIPQNSLQVAGIDPDFFAFGEGATASMDGRGSGEESADDGATASMDGSGSFADDPSPSMDSADASDDGDFANMDDSATANGGGGSETHRNGAGPADVDAGDAAEPGRIDVVLSAAAPDKLQIGRFGVIEVRLEVEGEAMPLDSTESTSIETDQDVLVTLQADSDHVEIVGEHRKSTPPPAAGAPQSLMFTIKAVSPGVAKFEVAFLQRSAQVGSIGLSTRVLKRANASSPVSIAYPARQLESDEDGKVTISVIAPSVLDEHRYRYEVTSRRLNLKAEEFVSPAFEEDFTGFREYIKGVYADLEDAFNPTVTDLADSIDRLEGIGIELGQALFSKELASELWKHREDIDSIELRSFDPYIPWELVKLWNPGSSAKTPDKKFLGEYGLVRHFSGDFAPRELGRKSWSYVIGDYKNQPGFDPVGEELEFFTEELVDDLSAPPISVRPQKQAIKSMFRDGKADVIHLACHGSADPADIGKAVLIVGVRPKVGGFTAVKLSTSDVRSSLKLNERRPIVFLNACQTGRLGITAGQTSGWPKVLWEGGAGAIVGTHWKVRSKAARSFAVAFYESLLVGDSLAVATGKGRTSARANGDVSWMAYVVYGDPAARMALP